MFKKINHNWSKISTAVLLLLGGAGVASLSHTANASANSRAPRITSKKRRMRRAPMRLINHNKLHNIKKSRKQVRRPHLQNKRLVRRTPSRKVFGAHVNTKRNASTHRAKRIAPMASKKTNQSKPINQNLNALNNKLSRTTSSIQQSNRRIRPAHKRNYRRKLIRARQGHSYSSRIGADVVQINTPRSVAFFNQPSNGTGTISRAQLRPYVNFIRRYKRVSATTAFNTMKRETNNSANPNLWQKYYGHMPKKDLVCKLLIGYCESGGLWNVQSPYAQGSLGKPSGRYQVSQNYFPRGHRSLSQIARNREGQEKIANKYMKRTYSNWQKAARHWMEYKWW